MNFNTCNPRQTPLQTPFEQHIYFTPLPTPDFHVGYLYLSIHRHTFQTCDTPQLWRTPYLTWRDGLKGYVAGSEGHAVLTSETGELVSGLGPWYWALRHANTASEIVLRPGLGVFVVPFRNQNGERLPVGVMPFAITRSGVTLFDEELEWGPFGVPEIPVSTPEGPGRYCIHSQSGEYLVGGQRGKTIVESCFDTEADDADPPYLVGFRLLDDRGPTDSVAHPGTQLVVVARDDGTGVDTVGLGLDDGSGSRFVELPLDEPDTYRYRFPRLSVEEGTLSLAVTLTDKAGNTITQKMSLPFHRQAPTEMPDPHAASGRRP